jgi:hypothetical protein
MVPPNRSKLSGEIEVDETYVGGVEPGVTGRETLTKSVVVVAVEKRPRGAHGRVRLKRISGPTRAELLAFITRTSNPARSSTRTPGVATRPSAPPATPTT